MPHADRPAPVDLERHWPDTIDVTRSHALEAAFEPVEAVLRVDAA